MTTAANRRWVLHVDLDAFFASAEQLTRPTLRGRPVLVGGLGARGVVAGASYEARQFGARSAMPMSRARRLVGAGVVVLPPRGVVYRELSAAVFDTLRSRVPVLETLSLDEAFAEPAELAGASAEEADRFCTELRAEVLQKTGLVASIGAGSGKQIAKIGSGLAKPDGLLVVRPEKELALLHGLPVRSLWGIGPVAEERLRKLGIDTIGHLAALPVTEVASILGTTIGPGLHRLANGLDDRPVVERAEAKQVSAETTYATDIVALPYVRRAVTTSATAAHERLRKDGRAARTVVLKLRKSDMSILTRSTTLPYPTEDVQVLTAAAQRLALDPLEIGPIRLVGVGFAGLSAIAQDSLFPELDALESEPSRADPVGDGVSEQAQAPDRRWRPGADVRHPDFGHGWVQGSGHGVVTIRFETRSTGPGPARTLDEADPLLDHADPLSSLQ
ncbi:DNA polymerase IV [Rhodococcus sp. F64268]|uniref:DNA polymerase IV n=1 Tax=Rhodococcus sp. F64268 TaxID=2926402 RepID=UPI001FF16D7B|nr:DNA polymerase IV [Rhodococcus sp. F64268]MCK0092887.1 DNA polymerase IV [Rhodococcus sp. F64268]